MKTLRRINIKNRPQHFCDSMTNIKNFDPSLVNTN